MKCDHRSKFSNLSNWKEEYYCFQSAEIKESGGSFSDNYLPPQGFGPEAKTRGGTLEAPACIHVRNFKNVKM